MNNLLIKLMIM